MDRYKYLIVFIVVMAGQLWILSDNAWSIPKVYTINDKMPGLLTIVIWLHLFWGVRNLISFINYESITEFHKQKRVIRFKLFPELSENCLVDIKKHVEALEHTHVDFKEEGNDKFMLIHIPDYTTVDMVLYMGSMVGAIISYSLGNEKVK